MHLWVGSTLCVYKVAHCVYMVMCVCCKKAYKEELPLALEWLCLLDGK